MGGKRHPGGAVTARSTTRRRVPGGRIARLVRFVARREGRPVDHVDVLVVGRRRMGTLNQALLGHRGTTDVISLDLGPGPAGGVCVQIIVCLDVADTQARRRGHATQKELLLYVVHGMLHVLGYDDATEKQASAMHRREDALLEAFGVGKVFAENSR